MFDVTVGETKDFEQLPEDTWIPSRIMSRNVIRYDGTSYKPSTDEILKKAFNALKAARDRQDSAAEEIANAELKRFQFQFVYKPLTDKKFAAYRVRGNTGLWMNFTRDGEPNKLAQVYTTAGGKKPEKGQNVDIDTIIGNYVAIQVSSEKNKKNNKVYQKVSDIRPLGDDELGKAKVIEVELKKIEEAVKAAEEKARTDAEPPATDTVIETQRPILESKGKDQEVPF
ncbi:MAG: hypothetical protein ACRD2L_09260 [Terriglobia bacterium]